MKKLVIIFFIGFCNLLYPQDINEYGSIFMTGPEVDSDLFYKFGDTLRNSIGIFFAKRISHIPKDYENEVNIFFTVKKDGEIKDIEFEEEIENQFNSDLFCFLENYKISQYPLFKYYKGDSLNVRAVLSLQFDSTRRFLNVGIDYCDYWIEERNYDENIQIRKLKLQYNKEDTIIFNIINNSENPLYYYVTIEGMITGLNNWIEVPMFVKKYPHRADLRTKVESNSKLSNILLVEDFNDYASYYRIVINYGFLSSAIDKKVYSYKFKIKRN